MVFGSQMGAVKVWSPVKGEEIQTLEGAHVGVLDVLTITPDGKQVVCASLDTVTSWNIERSQELWSVRVQDLDITSLGVTPDGRQLLCGSRDLLRIWDLVTGLEESVLTGHKGDVNAVIGIEQGERRLAVSASNDMTLKVWDLSTGLEVKTLAGHRNIVFALAAAPRRGTGRWPIVSASGDSTLKLWDLDSDAPIQTLPGHSALVYAVAVTPDGKRAVSGAYDRTIKVWDLENQEASHHSQGFSSVAMEPGGERAVFGRWDGTLTRWDLNTRRELESLSAPIRFHPIRGDDPGR